MSSPLSATPDLPAPNRGEPDRRDGERNPCEEARPVRLLARPSFQSIPAFVRDCSGRGLGLILMRPFEPGTLLALQLRKRQAGVSDILTAQVRHATQLADHYWMVGCRLSRNLSEPERQALLEGLWEDRLFGSGSAG
jgi:hypothetical protein